jgi:uncharacterized protein
MYLDLMDVVRMSGNATQKPIDIAPGKLDDIEIVEPVRGVVRAVNARHNIVVDGQAQTTVTMQCARCLSAYPQPLRLQLEAMAPLSFFRTLIAGASAAPEPDEDEADDELAALFDANSLDVLELVRQAIVLQSPLKPLCSPDCAGLPEAAKYMSAAPDSRWEALADWQTPPAEPDADEPDAAALSAAPHETGNETQQENYE